MAEKQDNDQRLRAHLAAVLERILNADPPWQLVQVEGDALPGHAEAMTITLTRPGKLHG
jgi:hypothetical protein